MSESNEILTAKEYSDRKGKDGSWGSRLAKRANENGYPFPQKKGNYWVSTYAQWEEVLEKVGIELRNRESYRKE